MPIETIALVASVGLATLPKTELESVSANEFDGWHWPLAVLNVGGVLYSPVVSDTYSAIKTATHREHHGCDVMYRRKSGGGPDQRYPRNTSEGTPNYFCPTGTEALCPREGKIYADGVGGKGEWVIIDCGKPIAIFMTHMRSRRVKKGDLVKPGDVIGTVSYSPEDAAKLNHMHIEVWRNGPSSAHVDPMPYLMKASYQ